MQNLFKEEVIMRKRYPEPTYEKEYRDAIQKRSQRIPVYKDFCVGDQNIRSYYMERQT